MGTTATRASPPTHSIPATWRPFSSLLVHTNLAWQAISPILRSLHIHLLPHRHLHPAFVAHRSASSYPASTCRKIPIAGSFALRIAQSLIGGWPEYSSYSVGAIARGLLIAVSSCCSPAQGCRPHKTSNSRRRRTPVGLPGGLPQTRHTPTAAMFHQSSPRSPVGAGSIAPTPRHPPLNCRWVPGDAVHRLFAKPFVRSKGRVPRGPVALGL